MATVAANPFVSRRTRPTAIAPALAVAAFASIGAGAIHAAAIGVHSEHRQAVIAFTIVAAVQIGWGVLALLSSHRALAVAGAVANAVFVGGWVLAKTSGIWFIDGLDVAESVQFADFAAAALAAVAVIGATAAAIRGVRPTSLGQQALVIGAVASTLVAVPAMVAAGSHTHAHGSGNEATHVHAGGGAGHVHTASAVAPKPYDPTKPIDLGGVPGVTLQQQARAENLIAITLARLPQFADYHAAEANGFKSIGDALTGDEHFINLGYFDDGRILDPDHPESLVYQPDGKGGKKLAAAMYMLAPNQTLNDVPDVGGKLTQWHIHDNLCFTAQGRVAGLTSNGGPCPAGLNRGSQAPMLHVWIEPHKCGPFAALEGIGAGQIKPGETRLCDAAHAGHA